MIEVLNNESKSKMHALEVHREGMSESDINDLRELRAQLSNRRDWNTVPINELLDDFYSHNGYSCMIRGPLGDTEDMQDRIIATGQLVINEKREVGTVESIVAHKAFRGQGLGRSIMKNLLQAARDRGLSKLELTSSESRVAAHGLYRSLGFEVVGKKQKYDESGNPTHETCLFELSL